MKAVFAVFVLGFGLSACAKKSSSTDGASAEAVTVLSGAWSQCLPNSGQSQYGYLQVKGYAFTIDYLSYPGTSCGGTSSLDVQVSGTFAIGVPSPAVSGATQLSLSPSATIQVTPTSAALVTSLNQQSLCGISNWSLNSKRAVTASSTCFSTIVSSTAATQLFGINGNQLSFGNSANTALDSAHPWNRLFLQ